MTNTAASNLHVRREHEKAKYLALAARHRSYGATNHGKAAVPLVRRIRPVPRLVVDFGCGCNDFIHELRRLGIDGLGIDFAFQEADVVAPMHHTGLLDGVADVVTSFDALEHLLPEDVDRVLEETRRVGRAGANFIFSICTRPSRIKVNGEGLHPTVMPLKWWLERIGRVGVVRETRAAGRYVTGRFKRDCCRA